jgi:hypothetical protein
VACDIPWLRNHFGDSLYYFNQNDTPARITERLREILVEIQESPATAAERAQRAREIFETHFAADVLLQRAMEYFEAWRGPRTAPDRRAHPEVSVIVRCGGRSLSVLGRALSSLRDQTHGRVTAILVMWRDFGTAELQRFVTGGLVNLRVVKCLEGDRSATLTAGLQAIETPYFAILDDDDAWFPTHLERVFEVYRSSPSTRLVITGAIQETSTAFSIMGGGEERRRVHRFGFSAKASTAWEISGAFMPNAFVAETALLDWRLLTNPRMATAEDSHLVLGLAAKTPPRFNYSATAIQYESEDGSRFLQHPQRHEDELTLFTRRLCDLDQLIGPYETWRLLNTCLTRALNEPTAKSVNGRSIFTSPKIDYNTMRLDNMAKTPITLDSSRVTLCGQSHFLAKNHAGTAISILEVIPPEVPWAYGAVLDLQIRSPLTQDGLIVVTGEILKGVVAFTLFDEAEKEPLFRRVLAANRESFELHIPLIEHSCVGRLMIQVWEDAYGSQSIIDSVVIYWVTPNTDLTSLSVETMMETLSPLPLPTGIQELVTQVQAAGTEAQLRAALDRIASMESSKFWKLRRQWFRIRRMIGLGARE